MDRGRQLFSKIREQVSGWIVTGIMPRNARRRRFIEFPSGLAANTTPHAQAQTCGAAASTNGYCVVLPVVARRRHGAAAEEGIFGISRWAAHPLGYITHTGGGSGLCQLGCLNSQDLAVVRRIAPHVRNRGRSKQRPARKI
jgi:hypothetical protein